MPSVALKIMVRLNLKNIFCALQVNAAEVDGRRFDAYSWHGESAQPLEHWAVPSAQRGPIRRVQDRTGLLCCHVSQHAHFQARGGGLASLPGVSCFHGGYHDLSAHTFLPTHFGSMDPHKLKLPTVILTAWILHRDYSMVVCGASLTRAMAAHCHQILM